MRGACRCAESFVRHTGWFGLRALLCLARRIRKACTAWHLSSMTRSVACGAALEMARSRYLSPFVSRTAFAMRRPHRTFRCCAWTRAYFRMQIWDVKSKKLKKSIAIAGAEVIAIGVVGSHIWTSSADNRLTMWEPKAMKAVREVNVAGSALKAILALPEGGVWCADAGSVQVLDSMTAIQICRLENSIGASCLVTTLHPKHGRLVWCGGDVDSSARAPCICVWGSAKPALLLALLSGHTERVTCIVQASDRAVWSGSRDKRIMIWDGLDLKHLRTLEGHQGAVTALAVLNLHVWSAAEDRTIRVWMSDSCVCVKMLSVSGEGIMQLISVAGHDEVWAGAADGKIFIWSLNTPAPLKDSDKFVSEQQCIVAPGGAKYVGQVRRNLVAGSEGMRHGSGEQHYDDGAVYVGEWVADKRSGFGIHTHKNGDKYYGSWKSDMKEGRGLMVHSDGSSFDGTWLADVRDGRGTMYFPNGDALTGEWKDSNIVRGTFTKNSINNPVAKCAVQMYSDALSKRMKSVDGDAGLGGSKWTGGFIASFQYQEIDRVADNQMLQCDCSKQCAAAVAYLAQMLEMDAHPLGRLLGHFVYMFEASYHSALTRTSQRPLSARVLMLHAMDDVKTFIATVFARVRLLLPNIEKFGASARRQIERALLQRIGPTLRALYTSHFKEQDVEFASKLTSLQSITMGQAGIPERLRFTLRCRPEHHALANLIRTAFALFADSRQDSAGDLALGTAFRALGLDAEESHLLGAAEGAEGVIGLDRFVDIVVPRLATDALDALALRNECSISGAANSAVNEGSRTAYEGRIKADEYEYCEAVRELNAIGSKTSSYV